MKFALLTLFTVLFSFASLSQAQNNGSGGGYDHGNGGDMCERRFAEVREDIATWISKGGASDLRLPAQITLAHYVQSMLGQIKIGKVSCTEEKLFVGTAEKTCKNYSDKDGSRIVCNRKLFVETSDSDQYVLVHHEYAGLAGFEVNKSEQSDYSISSQITGYLENKIVKKLAVKALPKKEANPFDESICQGPTITLEEANKIGTPSPLDQIVLGTFTMYTRERRTDSRGRWGAWSTVSNRISVPDISGFYPYSYVPDYGVLNFIKADSPTVQLYSSDRDFSGLGIMIKCSHVGSENLECDAMALPTFSSIGTMITAVMTNKCAYLNYYKDSVEQPPGRPVQIKVQRHSVFISRY